MKVKLTENKLKQIVAESVKKVLNEMDWQTYMNAARKRKEQGKMNNAQDLENMSNQRFNQKHGRNYNGDVINGNVSMNGGYIEGNIKPRGKESASKDRYDVRKGNTDYSYDGNLRGGYDYERTMDTAKNDLEGYYNGKQTYSRNGWGWTNNSNL